MHKPRKMTMGTVPILDFRGLSISHPQGHGELGPPHFPGYTPAWCNRKLEHLYTVVYSTVQYSTVQYCTVCRTVVWLYTVLHALSGILVNSTTKYRIKLECYDISIVYSSAYFMIKLGIIEPIFELKYLEVEHLWLWSWRLLFKLKFNEIYFVCFVWFYYRSFEFRLKFTSISILCFCLFV